MSAPAPRGLDITAVLQASDAGDVAATDRLLPLVYDELRALAQSHLARERAGHTLQATAIVHEAYVRLIDQRRARFRDRHHFFAVAATTIRRVLVDHARSKGRLKRGGEQQRQLVQPVVVHDVEVAGQVAGQAGHQVEVLVVLHDGAQRRRATVARRCRAGSEVGGRPEAHRQSRVGVAVGEEGPVVPPGPEARCEGVGHRLESPGEGLRDGVLGRSEETDPHGRPRAER